MHHKQIKNKSVIMFIIVFKKKNSKKKEIFRFPALFKVLILDGNTEHEGK